MQPATMPLALRRNAVEPLRLQFKGLDANGAKVPLDITGRRVLLQVRLYPGAPDAPLLVADTSTGEIDVIDAQQGIVEIDWPSIRARIVALPSFSEAGDPVRPRVDLFAYDLLLISADGGAQAVLEGPVPVSYGVSRT